jgi:hypothetical protein
MDSWPADPAGKTTATSKSGQKQRLGRGPARKVLVL